MDGACQLAAPWVSSLACCKPWKVLLRTLGGKAASKEVTLRTRKKRCVCIYIYTYTCCIRIHIYVHTHIFIYTYLHMYMYIYIVICMYYTSY